MNTAKHTPGPSNENCPCKVEHGNFVFCPLHAAAPAMYEALRLLLGVDACHNKMIHCGECGYCKGMAALAQAEGR